MTIVQDFQSAVQEITTSFAKPVRIKYYSTGYGAGSYYDDDVSLTQSGNDFWTSGTILPVKNTPGSNDAILLEQGKILDNDTKLYIAGSISTSGILKIGLGSPPANEYSLLAEGITNWSVSNVDIIKKLYIRRLTTGSFIGEV